MHRESIDDDLNYKMKGEKSLMKNNLNEKGNIQVSESNELIIKNQGTGKWYTLLASNSIKDRYLIDTSVEGHKEYAVVKGLDLRDGTWSSSLGYFNSLENALVKYDCETVDLKKIPAMQLATLMEAQEAFENVEKAMFAQYVKEHLCINPDDEFIEKNYAKYKVDKDRLFETVEMKDDEGKTVGTLLERVDEEYVHWKIEHDNHAYAEELANDLCEVSTENEEKFNTYLSDKGLKDKDVYNLSMMLCEDLNSKKVDSILDVLNEKMKEQRNILSKLDEIKDSSLLERVKESLQKIEQHISTIKEQYLEQNLDMFEEIDENLIEDILDDDEKNIAYKNIDPKNLKTSKEKEMPKEKSIDKN